MTNSRARTYELAEITPAQICEMVNSRVCARASLPLLAKVEGEICDMTNSHACKHEIPSIIGRAMAR